MGNNQTPPKNNDINQQAVTYSQKKSKRSVQYNQYDNNNNNNNEMNNPLQRILDRVRVFFQLDSN